jgi:hypothetical protein
MLNGSPGAMVKDTKMVNVSIPVHPHVLIIVKTNENRVEYILATLQMT